MDVSVLTAVLAPCLGWLLAGADAAARELGAGVGADVRELARRLWSKLHPHLTGKPAALEAAQDVAERPDDSRARAALELQLEKLLAGLPELSEQIAAELRDAAARGVIAVGERSVAVGGNVTGSTIITGDNTSVQR